MENKELHKIAPTLSKLKEKGTGFTVPENYFNTTEEHIIREFKLKKITKNNLTSEFKTPKNYFESLENNVLSNLHLEKLQPKNKLEVPDNYFDSIEDNVFEKLKIQQKQPKVISLKQRLTKILVPVAIAASLLLIFTLTTNSNNNSFEAIATTEIENWIDNGQVDIDAYQLASIYNDIEIDDNFIAETISEDDLMEYLNDENIEQLILAN
ncbi:hypothetical protein R3X25_12220 [Lutibacter sp. TH_r2]|uniref:hypothetical protein n=1 Tax=Lutibacter sp. TH_r2 TaxID=3082083 RepID=UPI00295460F6|nr:hypothetical protein [Lutibacter sp. TH_r2]MDV7188050.1 hypothetical protein [Lutibacter sp. TH_r2]